MKSSTLAFGAALALLAGTALAERAKPETAGGPSACPAPPASAAAGADARTAPAATITLTGSNFQAAASGTVSGTLPPECAATAAAPAAGKATKTRSNIQNN